MKHKIHVEYENLEWIASQVDIVAEELGDLIRQLRDAEALLEEMDTSRVRQLLAQLRGRKKDGEKLYRRWDKLGRSARIVSRKFAATDQRMASGKIATLRTQPYTLTHVHAALTRGSRAAGRVSVGSFISVSTSSFPTPSVDRSNHSPGVNFITATVNPYVLQPMLPSVPQVVVRQEIMPQIIAKLGTAITVGVTPLWLNQAFDQEMANGLK